MPSLERTIIAVGDRCQAGFFGRPRLLGNQPQRSCLMVSSRNFFWWNNSCRKQDVWT